MALFHLPIPLNRRGKSPLFDHLAVPLCRCLERTAVTHLLELIFPYGHSQNHHASQCVLTPWPCVCAFLRNNQISLLEMFWIVSICWLHIIRFNALVFCETQYFGHFLYAALYRSPQGLKVAESWHCRFGLINGNFWVNQCSLELSSILCQAAVVKTAVCVRFLSPISKSKQFWTPFIFL